MVSILPAGGLATQGEKASPAMVLTWYSCCIPVVNLKCDLLYGLAHHGPYMYIPNTDDSINTDIDIDNGTNANTWYIQARI